MSNGNEEKNLDDEIIIDLDNEGEIDKSAAEDDQNDEQSNQETVGENEHDEDKTGNGGDELSQDEGDDKKETASFTQEELDSIVSKRLAEDKIKHAKAMEMLEAEKQKNSGLSEQLRKYGEFGDNLKNDEFVPDEIKKTIPTIPENNEENNQYSGVRLLDNSVSQRAELDAAKFKFNMSKHFGDESQIISDELGININEGKLPYDMVHLAANHPNGAKAVKEILSNKDLLGLLELSMYQEPDKFNLHFNNIADNLNKKVDKVIVNDKKPKPNDQIKSSSSNNFEQEEDTIYI